MDLPSLRRLALRMARRPWAADRFPPILVFVGGEEAVRAAEQFAEPLDGEVPYADVGRNGGPATLRDLLRQVAGENGDLGKGVPGTWLPAPRFPLVQFVLWVLRRRDELSVPENDIRPELVKDDDYAKTLEEWQNERTPLRSRSARLEFGARFLGGPSVGAALVTVLATEWFDTAGLTSGLILAGSVAGAIVATVALARGWASGTYRYSAFRHQPYVTRRRNDSLARYARRIGEEKDPRTVDRLLVHALLEDLRLAYRRDRPWPGLGRNGYATLLIRAAGTGTAGRDFLTTMHEVVVGTGRPAPLLVVAAAADWPPEPCAREHPRPRLVAPGERSLALEYDDWRARARRLLPCPYLVVPAERWQVRAGEAPPRGRGLYPARALAYWGMLTVTVLAPLGFGSWVVFRECEPGLTAAGGQCVGLSTATENFDATLAPVLDQIVAENETVPWDAKIFRVVYFAPLTRSPGNTDPGRSLSGTAAELSGLLARQREYNAKKSEWKMVVEFANPGQEYQNAQKAAEAVTERAAGDPTVTAVIGLGWSRVEVRDAVGTLRGAQMPGLSTSATADSVSLVNGKPSVYFFRMAAPNSAQARAAAYWLTEPGLPGADGAVLRNPSVAVLRQKDAKELYSEDLANQFDGVYTGPHRMYDFTDSGTLQTVVEEACRSDARVLYFTGRADQVPTLKDAWRSHCAKQGVVLFAGDDVTSAMASEVQRYGTDHDVDMRFISLSDPRPGGEGQSDNPHRRVVLRTLKDVEKARAQAAGDKKGAVGLAPDHAMLAYDAALAVTSAFDRFQAEGGGTDLRAGVHDNLRGLSVDGAAGTIEFAADRERAGSAHRPLWLISVRPGEPLRREAVCRPRGDEANCDPQDTGGAPAGP